MLSQGAVIFEVDIQNTKAKTFNFSNDFSIRIERDGLFNCFISWFDVLLFEDIILSTSPRDP